MQPPTDSLTRRRETKKETWTQLQNQVFPWIETLTKSVRGDKSAHEWLGDGIVLCTFANELHPGCIEEVHKHFGSNANFAKARKRDNVAQFVKVIRGDFFQLPDYIVFDPMDLVEPKDMNKVITCLHHLGVMANWAEIKLEKPLGNRGTETLHAHGDWSSPRKDSAKSNGSDLDAAEAKVAKKESEPAEGKASLVEEESNLAKLMKAFDEKTAELENRLNAKEDETAEFENRLNAKEDESVEARRARECCYISSAFSVGLIVGIILS